MNEQTLEKIQATPEFSSILNNLELERKKGLKLWWFLNLLFGVAVVALQFVGKLSWPNQWYVILLIGLVYVLISFYFTQKSYRRRIVTEVISALVKAISPDFSHHPKTEFTTKEFNHWKLCDGHQAHHVYGENMVRGIWLNTEFRFSFLTATYTKTRTDHDSQGRSTTHHETHIIFSGLILEADFNKHFHSSTQVYPKRILAGKLKTENPEFNENFSVHSKDDVEAFYILSPNFMEKILALKRSVQSELYLSFLDGKMILGIPMRKDPFPRPWAKSLKNGKFIETYWKNLNLPLQAIEVLELEKRIWSKE